MKKTVVTFVVLTLALVMLMPSVSAQGHTRQGAITTLMYIFDINCEGADLSVLEQFSDINIQDYGELTLNQLATAVEVGIINGYEDKTLRLDGPVTRAEFTCMIYRARDRFAEPEKITDYSGTYSDISSWHQVETAYCIEHGFLIGYGDKFGSDDPITFEQSNIILNRVKFGLTSYEKYMQLHISGVETGFDINAALASAYSEEVCAYKPQITVPSEKENYIYTYRYEGKEIAEDNPAYVKGQVDEALTEMLDRTGTLDCDKLQNPEYKEYHREPLMFSGIYGIEYPSNIIFEGAGKTNIDEITAKAVENGTKRESIHVFAPENCYQSVFPTAYTKWYACGYEYFRYTAGNVLPEGTELNTWYRRKVTVNYCDYVGYRNPPDLIVRYEGQIAVN